MSRASDYVAAVAEYHRRPVPPAPRFVHKDDMVAYVTPDGNLNAPGVLILPPDIALSLAEWIRAVFSDDVVTP